LEGVFGNDVVAGDGWGVQHGRALPSGELSVGERTLRVVVDLDPFGVFDES
jgi:hypothetical protein